eukprot:9981856-Alexandrium_andersonii.AAC.1
MAKGVPPGPGRCQGVSLRRGTPTLAPAVHFVALPSSNLGPNFVTDTLRATDRDLWIIARHRRPPTVRRFWMVAARTPDFITLAPPVPRNPCMQHAVCLSGCWFYPNSLAGRVECNDCLSLIHISEPTRLALI